MKFKRRLHFIVVPIIKLLGLYDWNKSRLWLLIQVAKDYQNWLNKLIKHHGAYTAAKIGKYVYGVAKRRALRLPPLKQDGPIWFKCDRYGLPTPLYRLTRLLNRDSAWSIKYSLLIYSGFQLINHPPVEDYETQLSGSNPKYEVNDWIHAFRTISYKYNLYRIRTRTTRLGLRSTWIGSKGPSGLIGILGSAWDAYVLLHNRKYQYIREGLGTIHTILDPNHSKADWELWLLRLSFFVPPSSKKRVPCLARHIFISEGGGKTRAVTPINYHIQVALKPFHDAMMEMLRRIPMDCSFSETEAHSWLKQKTAEGCNIDSIDLTAATDRFPAFLIYYIVKECFGLIFANRWLWLMKLPIRFSGSFNKETEFNVGAPMGIYALWPAYALSHHAMVRLAAQRCGISDFKDYRLRGDDVVIANQDVSKRYLEIAEELDLQLSSSKTFSSERDGPGVAEFSKRLFRNGKCLNEGFSLKQLVAAIDLDPFGLIEIVPSIIRWVTPSRRYVRSRCLHDVCTIMLKTRFKSRVENVVEYISCPWRTDLIRSFEDCGITIKRWKFVPKLRSLYTCVTTLLDSVIPKKIEEIELSFTKLLPRIAKYAMQSRNFSYDYSVWYVKQIHPVFLRGYLLAREFERVEPRLVFDKSSQDVWPTSRLLEILEGLTTLDVTYREVTRKFYRRRFSAGLTKDLYQLTLIHRQYSREGYMMYTENVRYVNKHSYETDSGVDPP